MSESGSNAETVDKSELLDQQQPYDTLDDRGVDDVLDEGIVSAERWSPGQRFGNTRAEELRGETLDQRIAQEEPEREVDEWDDDDLDDDEVGGERAGRLMAPGRGAYPGDDTVAVDVGIDGAGASAEEAAMHVIPDDDS